MTSLTELLRELMADKGSWSGRGHPGQSDSQVDSIIDRLKRVKKVKRLYSVLKEVVEPEPCPYWDQRRGKCGLGFNRGYECTHTKLYELVVEILKEAGVNRNDAEKLIERLQGLGLIAICDPVIRKDGEAAAKGAILGTILLGVLGGPAGAVMGAVLGGTMGWVVGEEKRYGPKRIVFAR